MTVLLDASALLALLHVEEGWEKAAEALREGGVITAVNLAEVAGKLSDHGVPEADAEGLLIGLGLTVVPFDQDLAYRTGRLRRQTRRAGLSLADRACLSLAQRDGLEVLTADHAWKGLVAGVDVSVLR